jgi:polar amino acid transport system substrate-binding protein
MSKQSTDFVRFVNGVLAQMRADGTWTSIYNHWLAATLGPASPPAAHYKD